MSAPDRARPHDRQPSLFDAAPTHRTLDPKRSADDSPHQIPFDSGHETAVHHQATQPGVSDPPRFAIDVIRSKKRKKSAQARLVGNTLEVRVPAWISAEQEAEFVDHFVDKFERQRRADRLDLPERARSLAATYGLPAPSDIRWVGNQRQRWGSCTPSEGTIRLSDRLAPFPTWVIDYVIVHELAHLVESGHDAAFWNLVNQYPLTERARGFLIAKSWGDDDG